MPTETLRIPRTLHRAIIEEARRASPLECCGLLAGNGLEAQRCYPLRNELESAVEYWSDPRDLLAAFRDMRERGLELVAIYHSHPCTPPAPSRTDLERNLYGDTVHLILSLVKEPPEMRAYRLGDKDYDEIPWELIPQPRSGQ